MNRPTAITLLTFLLCAVTMVSAHAADAWQDDTFAVRHIEKLQALTVKWWRVARDVNRSPAGTPKSHDRPIRLSGPVSSRKGEGRK